jgi:hypothetical protein
MMRSWIDHAGGVVWDPSPSLIAQLVKAAQPFWLDIENPTDEVIDQLASWLGLHPLAVDDSKQFGQCRREPAPRDGLVRPGPALPLCRCQPVTDRSSTTL